MKSLWMQAMMVQFSFCLFYGLVPWLVLRRRLAREVWPVQLVLALLAGVVTQSVWGLTWSTWIRQPALYESILYVGCWIGFACILWDRKAIQEPIERLNRLTPFDQVGFLAIFLLGFIIRLRHPLETTALGQSDAYTHLAMFREVMANGFLGNAAYPPGYAWIMVMPASVFRVDPYMLARFGGAFWGIALSLSVYYFLREGCRDKRAALAGAFLTISFPGFMLLHKTGVGAFANQVGLFILPLAFSGALLAGSRSNRRMGFVLLGISLIGIGLTVPMLLLHVGLVLILYMSLYGKRIWRLFPRHWLRWLWMLVPLLLLGGLYLLRFGSRSLSLTARILTTADEAASANLSHQILNGWTSIHMLLGDFFSIKHWGLGNLLMDGALALLFLLFVTALYLGVRRKKASWVMMGCWGGVAALQTATGFLQFTAYQREGWSLLIASACLGGLFVGWIWIHFRFLRIWMILGVVCSAGVTLWHPPAHALSNSTAEETLVRVARMLRHYPQILPAPDSTMKGISGFLHTHLVSNQSLSLITRPLLQDQMLPAVMGPNSNLWMSKWDIYKDHALGLNQSGQALVFLDRAESLDVDQLGFFADISPVAAQNFMRQQRISYAFNDVMEAYLKSLSDEEWTLSFYEASPELKIAHVIRATPRGESE